MSAITIAPTSPFNLLMSCERIIERSCLNAGLVIFTCSVWFLIYFSPVYRATIVPVTVSQESRSRFC